MAELVNIYFVGIGQSTYALLTPSHISRLDALIWEELRFGTHSVAESFPNLSWEGVETFLTTWNDLNPNAFLSGVLVYPGLIVPPNDLFPNDPEQRPVDLDLVLQDLNRQYITNSNRMFLLEDAMDNFQEQLQLGQLAQILNTGKILLSAADLLLPGSPSTVGENAVDAVRKLQARLEATENLFSAETLNEGMKILFVDFFLATSKDFSDAATAIHIMENAQDIRETGQQLRELQDSIDNVRREIEKLKERGSSLLDEIQDAQNSLINDSKLSRASSVEPFYYRLHNSDVRSIGVDATQHYETYGWREDRDPNPLFDTSFYLEMYPDVAKAGINPLEHYVQVGWREGRDPSAVFSTREYLRSNPDVASANVNPMVHYLTSGYREGRGTSEHLPMVDEKFYLDQNRDVWKAGVDASAHYMNSGWREGRDPNPLFDTSFYLQKNPDVAANNVNPLIHYREYGWREGRDPSMVFSTSGYLEANPDVAAAGVNPLEHYLNIGEREGRLLLDDFIL